MYHSSTCHSAHSSREIERIHPGLNYLSPTHSSPERLQMIINRLFLDGRIRFDDTITDEQYLMAEATSYHCTSSHKTLFVSGFTSWRQRIWIPPLHEPHPRRWPPCSAALRYRQRLPPSPVPACHSPLCLTSSFSDRPCQSSAPPAVNQGNGSSVCSHSDEQEHGSRILPCSKEDPSRVNCCTHQFQLNLLFIGLLYMSNSHKKYIHYCCVIIPIFLPFCMQVRNGKGGCKQMSFVHNVCLDSYITTQLLWLCNVLLMKLVINGREWSLNYYFDSLSYPMHMFLSGLCFQRGSGHPLRSNIAYLR
jgi:hypothetical protein